MDNMDFGASAPKNRESAPTGSRRLGAETFRSNITMPSEFLQNRAKWVLSSLGGLVVVYCLMVLWYVATTPDVGLRCLLISDPGASTESETTGLQIRRVVAEADERGWPSLAPGDRLLE